MTKHELKQFFYDNLSKAGVESAAFEAGQLAEFTEPIKKEQTLNRRLNGEPLQYILGEWEFYGITLSVGEGVLIPRADTETVVETALTVLKGIKNPTVFDLCAGSGCIGIAVAKHSDAEVKFFEKSAEALYFLTKNVKATGISGEIINADVLSCPDQSLYGLADVIVSNPPYIRSDVVPTLSKEVGFEPKMALDGGEDGLIFYRFIAKHWKKMLKPDGYLVFEIGFDQAEEVSQIMQDEGFFEVTVKKDLCGNNRVVYGKK